MTIASEITRLQWAKASIEASIENKWITVPDSAKIDTYSLYIDQISASASWLATWITTYPKQIAVWVQYWVQKWPFITWNDDTWLYWACAYAEQPSGDEKYWVSFFSKTWTSDIQYYQNAVRGTRTYNPVTENLSIYKQWTTVYAFFTSWSTNANYCWFVSTRNLTNNSVSTTCVWWVSTLNPSDWWYDVTWWTQITGSSWVQDITAERVDTTWRLYLTLKMNSGPRRPWETHITTPSWSTGSYYSYNSNFVPLSWEYNWTAYGVANYYYYTGSSGFRDYEWVICCKITPDTWIAWTTFYNKNTYSDNLQNRQTAPVTRSVWRNDSSSMVKIYIFLNQIPSSSYPHLSATYCFQYIWDTTTWVITSYAEQSWTLYDYDPTSYWYDITWYTQVTDSSWVSGMNLSKSWDTEIYSFNIKD